MDQYLLRLSEVAGTPIEDQTTASIKPNYRRVNIVINRVEIEPNINSPKANKKHVRRIGYLTNFYELYN